MRRASECRGSAIANYEHEETFNTQGKYFDLFNSLLKPQKYTWTYSIDLKQYRKCAMLTKECTYISDESHPKPSEIMESFSKWYETNKLVIKARNLWSEEIID